MTVSPSDMTVSPTDMTVCLWHGCSDMMLTVRVWCIVGIQSPEVKLKLTPEVFP